MVHTISIEIQMVDNAPRHSSNRSDETRVWRRSRGTFRSRRGFTSRKTKIPDNWVDVCKIGTRIPSTRFIAMRVPLNESFTISHRDEQWTPSDFLTTQKTLDLNVGMVVDLTNTSKYYNGAQVFQSSDIRYHKLPVEGHKSPPSLYCVNQFIQMVETFEATSDKAIVVHCTHGLNRTGYLIVSYLVRQREWKVYDALTAFAQARPPGLLKQLYIDALYNQYDPDGKRFIPDPPEWARNKYAKKSLSEK